MHPNPIFRNEDVARSLAFAETTGFGHLVMNGDGAPLAAHIPFHLTNNGKTAELHLVRSNPIARTIKDGAAPAKLMITGPHGYISPDWYGIEDQVPTWNYVAVHLIGQLEMLPEQRLRDIIDRLSDAFEAKLAPKPVWKSTKMTPEVMDKMMRQIVPCRLRIEDVQSTWKLGQNKPDAARLGAADQIRKSGVGAQTADLADLMQRAEAPENGK